MPAAAVDLDEQVLVRRVVTVLCGLALLSVPLLHVGLGTQESWISVVHLVVLGIAFAALGRTRLATPVVVTTAALLLWVVTLVSVGMTALSAASDPASGVGLGTGALWLAAGMAPAIFLVLPLRRALWAGIVATVGFVAMTIVVTGGAAVRIATHPGVWQVLVSVVVVLGATAAVAWLAGRSADERRLALLLRQQHAAVAAGLEASQRRRSALFSRTATELEAPMGALAAALEPLRGASDGDVVTDESLGALRRVEQLASDLLARVVEHIDGLVRRIQEDAAAADVVLGDDDLAPDDHQTDPAAAVLMTFGVLAMVALDAYRVGLLSVDGVVDPHAVAAGANRMLVVLFLAAAVLAVRFPGRFGWWLTGLALLVHPVVVLGIVDPVVRDAALPPFAAAWRVAVLSAGMLALLAMIIERRVQDRDALVAAASGDEARSAELRRREEAADLAYAEAAHELKNPLAVIRGAARALVRHGPALPPAQATKLLIALTHGVDRLDARLAVMRSAATDGSAGRDRGSRDRRPAAAADVLLDAVAAARPQLDDRALDVDVRVTGDWTTADPEDVEHVVENLLGNAHKYGAADGVVRLTAYREGGEIVVEVANRGGDLSRAEAARVFEPYWRAANAQGADGTGIGLAVVARLVEGWGGRCWARAGGGWTRVGFTMPVAESVQAPTWQELQDQLG